MQPAVPRDSPKDDRAVRRTGETPGAPPARAWRHLEKPPATQRCAEEPDEVKWVGRTRDVQTQLKRVSRRMGMVTALRVPDELTVVKGASERPAGWRAYAFAVPAKGNLRVTLNHPNKAWFQLLMTNKWGETERGMLQNVVGTSRLEVSFENPLDEVRAVYVLVDDPGWKSTEESPFALTITRNWGPGKVGPDALAREDGVWAIAEPIVKKNAVPAEAALPEG